MFCFNLHLCILIHRKQVYNAAQIPALIFYPTKLLNKAMLKYVQEH